MGEVSYQGAVGGFVFICPVSGRIKVRLYATSNDRAILLRPERVGLPGTRRPNIFRLRNLGAQSL